MSRRFSYFLIYDVQLFYLLLFSREFYCFLTCQFSFCVLYGRGCAAFLQRHKLQRLPGGGLLFYEEKDVKEDVKEF